MAKHKRRVSRRLRFALKDALRRGHYFNHCGNFNRFNYGDGVTRSMMREHLR